MRKIEIFVNGVWDASFEERQELVIYDKGEVHTIDAEDYEEFIDELEKKGFDCYLCIDMFTNPNWDGGIIWDLRQVTKQLELQEEIVEKSGINIVSCGNCGATILHRCEAEQITCHACGYDSEPCDFPDLNY